MKYLYKSLTEYNIAHGYEEKICSSNQNDTFIRLDIISLNKLYNNHIMNILPTVYRKWQMRTIYSNI